MMLYNYTYEPSNHKLTVDWVEVTETAKTYRAINHDLLNYRRTVNKDELDTLIKNWNYYMVSLTENKKLFINKIQESLQRHIEDYKTAINKCNNDIMFLDMEKESTDES